MPDYYIEILIRVILITIIIIIIIIITIMNKHVSS